MPPTNHAAYMASKTAKKLSVSEAPYTAPARDQIVIRVGATAINPLDWGKLAQAGLVFPWLKYPIVLGSDCAGTVVEVGPGVTRFKQGDRVVGHAVGMDKRAASEGKGVAAEGAFQEFVVLRTNLTCHIPANMSFERACVIPLGASTAACGLFMANFLALPPPRPLPERQDKPGETFIVWGGSTSVGCNAIQLARAAGYEIITTSSPRNFDLMKRLGAAAAFDYRDSAATVRDIIAYIQKDKKTCAGAIAIGDGSLKACFDIVAAVPNAPSVAASRGTKFVAQATFGPPEMLKGELGMLGFASAAGGMAATLAKARFRGIKSKFIFGSDLMENEVGKMLYEDYLPAALAEGSFLPAPEPLVVGKGLDRLQEALEVQIKGVSAKKVVVTLE